MRENIPLVKAPRRASGPLVGGMQCNGPRERVGVHRVLCDHYVVLAFGINNPSRSLHPVRKILLPEVEIDRLGLPGRRLTLANPRNWRAGLYTGLPAWLIYSCTISSPATAPEFCTSTDIRILSPI